MSEQPENSLDMSFTESELRLMCFSLAAYIEQQCALIEAEELDALEAHNQKELDTARSLLHKAMYVEELECGEGSEMNPLKRDIFILLIAVGRATALRDERLEALLPQ